MSTKPAEVGALIAGTDTAHNVAWKWDQFKRARQPIEDEWQEQRDYVFATSTLNTSVNENTAWKNSTTIPKLTQIRDNLHSNYLQAMMPNDEWLRWSAHTPDANKKVIAETIEAYMRSKLRLGGFRTTLSQLLYDYIDYGNVFAAPTFQARYRELGDTKIRDFIGPRVVRISPLDVVFNPTAASFKDSWKIIRSIKTIGELKTLAEENPDQNFWAKVVADRTLIKNNMGSIQPDDWPKQEAYQIDGFGNLQEYYESDYVEILEFYGDWHNADTGAWEQNIRITVADRRYVADMSPIPNWLGHAPIYHAGWRKRPDNLWAMGPLANLVGMQYRLDHLENAKADAFDLAIHPPLVVVGEVEQFNWGPECEIHIDEGGQVTEVARNLNAIITADTQMQLLMQLMEEFAGAPRQAMGIRTPGEKTAFEVQTLENAAGRIFQEKTTTFESELLEPLMNGMLEVARRNLDGNDVIATLDSDLGAKKFIEITRDDITANGVLRPIGARHFAAQAQLVQNLVGIMASPLGPKLDPHLSGKQLSNLVEDTLGLERFELFRPNIAVIEAQETARLAAQSEEDLAAEDAVEAEIVRNEG